ncbi:MAG: protein-glutamate methylesterase/protein-glutamine glutaminase [Lacipirellulaceae bacterium]
MKCLVVDDSALYRKIVRDCLASIPEVEVVGTAADGRQALERIGALRPDLVTLDLEMPHLDGIGVLRELGALGVHPTAIMVSAFTARGAQATTTALQLGAFDFILKPTTGSLDESVLQLKRDLVPKVMAALARRRPATPAAGRLAPLPALAAAARPVAGAPAYALKLPTRKPDVVAIGVSTGGPQALTRVIPKLPADFPAPIVIVQHMPPMFTKSLADDLNRRSPLHVMEASHGQPLRAGEVLIAPGGKHMRVVNQGAAVVVQLTDDPPERNCRPAVDYLFRSVAQVYGARTLAAVLTGMGDDGALGAKALKQAGATVLAQDEASCVVYGMPKAIVDAGLADAVLPLDRIPDALAGAVQRRVAV